MVRAVAPARGSCGIAPFLAALACMGGGTAWAEPPPGSSETRICVHVFDDRNGDGAQQLPEEVGLAGWSVRVSGGRPAYLSTGDDGLACTAVHPGSTSVQVPALPGWAPTSRVALRVLVASGGTTDAYAGFRSESGSAPATPADVAPGRPPEAAPTGREARVTVGAALPATCKVTRLRMVTTSASVDLAVDRAVPIGATSIPTADVVEARFSYEGPGGVPSVVLVTASGAVFRVEGTIRALEVRAELPAGAVYAYDWEAGRERGCPAPSLVRFAPPPPPGRAGQVARVGLPDLEGTITVLRFVTARGTFDLVGPGGSAFPSATPVPAEDVGAVHLFSEGWGERVPLRLVVVTRSGRAFGVPGFPSDPILSLALRVAVPGAPPYEFLWEDGRSRSGPIPLVVRFPPSPQGSPDR